MAVFEIPLSPTPQRFGVTILQVSYQLTVRYRETPDGGWFLDIATPEAVPILNGLPLVTGADLLAQYGYLGFGFSLVCQTDHDPDAVPTFTNLGITSHVFVVTPDG